MVGDIMEITINDNNLIGYDHELTLFKLYRNNVKLMISYLKRKKVVTIYGIITTFDLANEFILVNDNIKIKINDIIELKIEA